MNTTRNKKVSSSSTFMEYTKDIFVYKDRTVRNSQGKFLGQYIGRELDNFIVDFSDEYIFCPLTPGGLGFYVVYIFVKKDEKYYKVDWAGEFKEISFLELSFQRICEKENISKTKRKVRKNFKLPLTLLNLLVAIHKHGYTMEDIK